MRAAPVPRPPRCVSTDDAYDRPTPETQGVLSASRDARSRCRKTTSPSWKVRPNAPCPGYIPYPRTASDPVLFLTHSVACSLFGPLTSRAVEKNRITAAGGFVDFGRVNGNLALSRAIGDFEFKKSAELSPEAQIVTAYPDVEVHDITDDDEFLVLACDGECPRERVRARTSR